MQVVRPLEAGLTMGVMCKAQGDAARLATSTGTPQGVNSSARVKRREATHRPSRTSKRGRRWRSPKDTFELGVDPTMNE